MPPIGMIHSSHALLTEFRRWVAVKRRPPAAYIVGGAVRDFFLERSVQDVDIAVTGPCAALCREFSKAAKAHLVVVGQAFQSHRVLREGSQLEFASIQGDSIEEDLFRRDLTVNAMALPLDADEPEGDLIDPCRGMRDLRNRTIRMVRAKNLEEDPVRLLRVFRFASSLGFQVHTGTLRSIRKRAPLIRRMPGERIYHELKMILSSPRTSAIVETLSEVKVLFELFPELAETVGVSQNRYHHLDVWQHTLAAVREADLIMEDPDLFFGEYASAFRDYFTDPGHRTLTRLGILLHDVGKPWTRVRTSESRIAFYRHEEKGAAMAGEIMKRLRSSRDEDRLLQALVRNHLRIQRMSAPPAKTSAVVRLIREMEDGIFALIVVGFADLNAKRGPWRKRSDTSEYLGLTRRILQLRSDLLTPRPVPSPILTGHDLMNEFSLEPSPLIGRLLSVLEEAVLEGRVTTRAQALKFTERMLADPTNWI